MVRPLGCIGIIPPPHCSWAPRVAGMEGLPEGPPSACVQEEGGLQKGSSGRPFSPAAPGSCSQQQWGNGVGAGADFGTPGRTSLAK